MGFFDKLQDVVKAAKKFEGVIDSVKDVVDGMDNKASKETKDATVNKGVSSGSTFKLANSTHVYEDTDYCDDDEYTIRYTIDDSFEEDDCGAGEVSFMNTYSQNGKSCDLPYVAVQNDNFIYNAVEAFKEKGSFPGAIDLVPLSGKFYFKAKKEYGDNMAYFYGLDRCDGFWVNNGLCIVYPKSYVGTEDEKKAMQVLDVVADSYVEIKI